MAKQMGDKDLSMEVYSGLYVDENEDKDGGDDLDDDDVDKRMFPILPFSNTNNRNSFPLASLRNVRKRPTDTEEFCISMRKFAIGVAIASLLLMFAVILLVICILQRRRRRHQHRRLFSSGSTIGSGSIYSGPYTNRAYSRD